MAKIFGIYFFEEMILNMERKRGFLYIDDLNKLMKEYENQRTKYPTYEDFYPRIIEFFKNKHHQLDSNNPK